MLGAEKSDLIDENLIPSGTHVLDAAYFTRLTDTRTIAVSYLTAVLK